MTQQAKSFFDRPLAAIDVGSNTIHLVVGIPHQAGSDQLEVLIDELEFVRLGAGVGQTGYIAAERFERGLAVLAQLYEQARRAGAEIILGAATEVMRQAANGPEFLARAKAMLGLEIPVISGDQEAALTFWGATSNRTLRPDQVMAVADLGGGSMELALGTGQRLAWRRTMQLGSGTLHDRFIRSDPPTAEEMATLRTEVATFLARLDLPAPLSQPELFIACGGTATTILTFAWNALGSTPAHHSLSRTELEQAIAVLSTYPAAEIAQCYGVEEPRATILGAGTVVLATLMDRLGTAQMEISERGIREGIILSYARHAAAWLEAAERGDG